MDNKLDTILRTLELQKCHSCCGYQKGGNGGNEGGGGYATNRTESMDILLSEETSINESMIDLPNRTGTLESEELTRRLERLKDQESFDAEGKRSGSRFTITPSFLTPEPTLIHCRSIDINSSPESSVENAQNNEEQSKSGISPSFSNMKKYRSAPNLPKPTLKDEIMTRDDIKRSSSVHFDESSLIKHRSTSQPSGVPLHEVTPPPPSELCTDVYVSDLDSLDSNSVTPPTGQSSTTHSSREQDSLSRSREDNKTDNNDGDDVAMEMTPIRTSSEPTLILSPPAQQSSENGHIQHHVTT